MAPSFRRLRNHAGEIEFLSKCSPRQRKAFLKHAYPELVASLCECASNVLKGNVPLSRAQKSKLSQYKKHLRDLSDNRLSNKKRKDILVQRGGFLSLLLKPIIQSLGGMLLGAKKTLREPIELRVAHDSTPSTNNQTTDTISGKISEPDDLIHNFPKSIKGKAKVLLERIDRHCSTQNDPTVDWNSKGELLYKGEAVPGSNITDLIIDVLQSRKDFNPNGWQHFISGLKGINFPEAFVGNLKRRQFMHQLKEKDKSELFVKELPTLPRSKRRRKVISSPASLQKRLKSIRWDIL
ncbi:hypothetical protein HOLleu_30184 [Holothuria leucospilota]|uniref:Uncharacterized protein n=1 Tax=Holothuria leucospilota TaxID=206669 RepID=A0A9Q1BK00_HOLLE|nr:hypothetical protein HOLleu_30184 [Holothuria leucospilota]